MPTKKWYVERTKRINLIQSIMNVLRESIGVPNNKEERTAVIASSLLLGDVELILKFYQLKLIEEGGGIPRFISESGDDVSEDIEMAWSHIDSNPEGFNDEELEILKLKTKINKIKNVASRCHASPEFILRGCIKYFDLGMSDKEPNSDLVVNVINNHFDYFKNYMYHYYGAMGYAPPLISSSIDTEGVEADEEQLDKSYNRSINNMIRQIALGNIYHMMDELRNIFVYREYVRTRNPRPNKMEIKDLQERQDKYVNANFISDDLSGNANPFDLSPDVLMNKLKISYITSYYNVTEDEVKKGNVPDEILQSLRNDAQNDIDAYRRSFYTYSAEMLQFIKDVTVDYLIDANKFYDDIDLTKFGETDDEAVFNIDDIFKTLKDHVHPRLKEKLDGGEINEEELDAMIEEHVLVCRQYYNPKTKWSPNFMWWKPEHINKFRTMVIDDLTNLWGSLEDVPEYIKNRTLSFIINSGSYQYKDARSKRVATLYDKNGLKNGETTDEFRNYRRFVIEYAKQYDISQNQISNKAVMALFEIVPVSSVKEFIEWIGEDQEEINRARSLHRFLDFITNKSGDDSYYNLEANTIFHWYYGCGEDRSQKQQSDMRRINNELSGVSSSMKSIKNQILNLAKKDRLFLSHERTSTLPQIVYVYGETGTGKEKVARLLHDLTRSDKPFVPVNCSILPENDPVRIREDLFGHDKGAYTGADKSSEGAFGVAKDGDMFLDEIQSLPKPAVEILKRVLESGDYTQERLGNSTSRLVQCRIIIASNEPINNIFPEDFVMRVASQSNIEIPSLSERLEDVKPLAERFLGELNDAYDEDVQLSEEALGVIKNEVESNDRYGNARIIRELIYNGFFEAVFDDKVIQPENITGTKHTTINAIKYLISNVLYNIKQYYHAKHDIINKIVNRRLGDVGVMEVVDGLADMLSNPSAARAVANEIFADVQRTGDDEHEILNKIRTGDNELFFIIFDHAIESYYKVLESQSEVTDEQQDWLSDDFSNQELRDRLFIYGKKNMGAFDKNEIVDALRKWEDVVDTFYARIKMQISPNTDIGKTPDQEIFNWLKSLPAFNKSVNIRTADSHDELVKSILDIFDTVKNEDVDLINKDADLIDYVGFVKPAAQQTIEEEIIKSLEIDITPDDSIEQIAREI